MNIFNFNLSDIFRKKEKRSIATVDSEGLPMASYYMTPNEAITVNTVHACVNIISGAVARLPLNLYKKTEHGRIKATNHILYDLTTSPNYDMTNMSFYYALTANLLLYGNAFCKIIRLPSGKVKLQLIPSQYVTINTDKEKVTYTVNRPNSTDIHKKYQKSDILHIVGETLDGIKGESPVCTLAGTVKFAKILEKFGLKYFENGANPSGTLNLPDGKTLKEENAKRLKRQFEKYYQGLENSGKILLLEDGLTYSSIQAGNDSSQYLQTKEAQIEEIARIFNVPLYLLQKTDKATSWGSGIEQMGIDFVVYTLDVWVKRIEQALNYTLLSVTERDDYYFEFNLEALLRGATKERAEYYNLAIKNGYMSPNEIRQKENMPPIKGGNLYFSQLNQPPYAGEDLEKYKKLFGDNSNGTEKTDTNQ